MEKKKGIVNARVFGEIDIARSSVSPKTKFTCFDFRVRECHGVGRIVGQMKFIRTYDH